MGITFLLFCLDDLKVVVEFLLIRDEIMYRVESRELGYVSFV
jgi:hypothetical protein